LQNSTAYIESHSTGGNELQVQSGV